MIPDYSMGNYDLDKNGEYAIIKLRQNDILCHFRFVREKGVL